MSKIQQHVKGSLSRSQSLERVINEVSGFIFNGSDFSVKPVHYITPACSMPETEGIKSNLKKWNNADMYQSAQCEHHMISTEEMV